ncbi:hypothetical protein SBRCBS47491_003429 [Sporothrix bragantina]|uniref:Uncharacterized protein n=1 Tax=Sporothrix bragantina TaxID=671064 RepID=A0ABP0BFB7_9PEZI
MYLRRHGEEIHQALDVRVNPTTYSEERQQLEVLVTPNVKAALEWYRKENNDVTFDVFNCSWDDLFDQMARAQGEHEARVNRKGNWFKYLWRKAGSKKEAIEPWLQLIPDEQELRRSLTPVPSREEELILSPDELLDILGVSMDTVNDDLRLAIRQGSDFSRKAHEQAQSLFGEPRFESWMGSPKAKLLLVDGNDASAARKMMSPMSHLCAQMSSALEGAHGRDNVILLHFWCSMHTDIDTEARGPRGMVRALLVQLMAALLSRNHRTQFNFGPVREREFIADLKHGNLEALRRAFVELLIMVPRQMPIFVIIDNVAVFENDPFQDDLYTVVSMIGDFVSANRRIIKVLMTCPYRDTSLVQRRLVSRNEHVVLEIGGRGGLGRITEQSVLSHISKDFSDSSPRDYRDVETPEQFRR